MPTMNSASLPNACCRTCTTRAPTPISTASWSSSWSSGLARTAASGRPNPASFSVNVGMGTIADPKFASFVATSLKTHKVPPEGAGLRDHREVLRRAGARRRPVRPGLRKDRLSRGARRLHVASQFAALVRLVGAQVPQARPEDHGGGDERPRAAGAGRGDRAGLQGVGSVLRRQAGRYPGRSRLAVGRGPRLCAGFPARPAARPEPRARPPSNPSRK